MGNRVCDELLVGRLGARVPPACGPKVRLIIGEMEDTAGPARMRAKGPRSTLAYISSVPDAAAEFAADCGH